MRRWTVVSWMLIVSTVFSWMLQSGCLAQTSTLPVPRDTLAQAAESAGSRANSPSGTERWRVASGDTLQFSPVVSNGMVYAGFSNSDSLYAYDAASGAEMWQFTTGSFVGSPVISDGIAYVGSYDGNLYAIDASSGAERWRFSAGENRTSLSTVIDGVIYISSSISGNVYAIDAVSGAERWMFAIGASVSSSFVVTEGIVYVGSYDNYLYAIDAASGTQRWRFAVNAAQETSPVAVGGVVYIGSPDADDDNLYAVDAASGTERWRFMGDSGVSDSPVLEVDGVVYVGSDYGDLYAIDAASGIERWRFAGDSGVNESQLLVVDGVVYVGGEYGNVRGDDDDFYAIDAVSGTERWRFTVGGSMEFSPALVNGVVYVGGFDGNLYAIDTVDGNELWHFTTGSSMGSSPVVMDGVVYVGSNDGTLYAIEPPTSEAIATRQMDQAWDTYYTDLSTALRTSPDLPTGFTGIEGGAFDWPVPNPVPEDSVGMGGARFVLSAASGLNGVFVVRYGTAVDGGGAVATAAIGLTRAGWAEVEVDGVEHDHACLALESVTDAKAICYVERDAFVLVAYSYLPTANVNAATTNATDLAVYANAVFDRVPRPAS